MASTLLEETRQAHDDVERLERLIAKDFRANQPTNHKDKLLQSHRVRQMLDAIQDRQGKLVRRGGGGCCCVFQSSCVCACEAAAPFRVVGEAFVVHNG